MLDIAGTIILSYHPVPFPEEHHYFLGHLSYSFCASQVPAHEHTHGHTSWDHAMCKLLYNLLLHFISISDIFLCHYIRSVLYP